MLTVCKSEFLKQRRCGIWKVLIAAPLIVMLLAVLTMPVDYRQTNAYNMWYMFLLPFVTGYVAGTLLTSERRYLYHGLFAILEEKRKLWYAKIVVGIFYLLFAGVVMSTAVWLCGSFLGTAQISMRENAAACLLLSLTFAWQIPVVMYLTLKSHKIFAILVCTVANIVCACSLALKEVWWIPFAIPARLMCRVLGILPNGLLVAEGDFNSTNVVVIGTFIGIVLLLFFSVVTAKRFEKEEAA